MSAAEVDINAGRVPAVKAWWQYYPLGDPEGIRTTTVQMLDEVGGYDASVSIRGDREQVRALAAALVELVDLLELVEPHERVDVVVRHPATEPSVDQ